MQCEDKDEKLEPMPPPPAPQAPPNVQPLRLNQRHQVCNDKIGDDEELLTPQSPPIPHTHPLMARSDESVPNVELQEEEGGMAIHCSQELRSRGLAVPSKRVSTTSLNRERVKAYTERVEDAEKSYNLFAVEHSRRSMEKRVLVVQLSEQERIIAATEASARRHDLLQTVRQAANESRSKDGNDEIDWILSNRVSRSALERASERKVRKQLNSKWVQMRQDPSNCPKGPLERPEERGLRETLFRTSVSDLLQSGVLYDETDATRNATFGPISLTELPVISSGIVGLAGCCFETYDHEY